MILTTRERMELQHQAKASNGRADSARHTRLILLLADSLTETTMATECIAQLTFKC